MRLICPNCDAQYEVDAAMIPEGGRDVQCSSCGHTWFKRRDPEKTAAPASVDPDIAMSTDTNKAVPDPQMPDTQKPAQPAPEDSAPGDAAIEDPSVEPIARRELDPETRAILREEAEREAAARRGDREPLETQPDLGLTDPEPDDDTPTRAGDKTDHAPKRPAEIDAAAAALVAAGSRGDLLPDIEEINSTLTATSDADDDDYEDAEDDRRRGRRGFRFGFLLIVLTAALLILAYILAPAIATAVPVLEPALASYVEQVNMFRSSLDLWLQAASRSLIDLAGGGDTGSG